MKWIYIFNLLNKIKQYQINIKLPKIEKILKLDIKTLEYLVKVSSKYFLKVHLHLIMQ